MSYGKRKNVINQSEEPHGVCNCGAMCASGCSCSCSSKGLLTYVANHDRLGITKFPAEAIRDPDM